VQLLAAQIGLEPGELPVVPVPPSGPVGTQAPPRYDPDAEQPPYWPPPPGWRPRAPE
jgi:hypothetical protein